MLTKIGIIEDIMIYEDIYMEDDKIILGYNQDSVGYKYIIANTKTSKLIAKIGLNRYRKEKLENLNNNSELCRIHI